LSGRRLSHRPWMASPGQPPVRCLQGGRHWGMGRCSSSQPASQPASLAGGRASGAPLCRPTWRHLPLRPVKLRRRRPPAPRRRAQHRSVRSGSTRLRPPPSRCTPPLRAAPTPPARTVHDRGTPALHAQQVLRAAQQPGQSSNERRRRRQRRRRRKRGLWSKLIEHHADEARQGILVSGQRAQQLRLAGGARHAQQLAQQRSQRRVRGKEEREGGRQRAGQVKACAGCRGARVYAAEWPAQRWASGNRRAGVRGRCWGGCWGACWGACWARAHYPGSEGRCWRPGSRRAVLGSCRRTACGAHGAGWQGRRAPPAAEAVAATDSQMRVGRSELGAVRGSCGWAAHPRRGRRDGGIHLHGAPWQWVSCRGVGRVHFMQGC
jgi:hypothetical protein